MTDVMSTRTLAGVNCGGVVIKGIPKQKRIKLTKKQESELRKQVWTEQKGKCADCGDPTLLYETGMDKWGREINVFNVFTCGHLRHKKGKGAGGNDTIENREIACPKCHSQIEHGPQWSKS